MPKPINFEDRNKFNNVNKFMEQISNMINIKDMENIFKSDVYLIFKKSIII